MPDQLPGHFSISIAGIALPAQAETQLVSATVEDNLNLPDMVVLRFRDPHRTLVTAAGVSIGAALVVSAVGPASPTPVQLAKAEVTAVDAEIDSTGTFTVVRGLDAAHRLFRGRSTHSYRQVTASDVATAVARRAGLTIGTVQSAGPVLEHLSQSGVSDWQFLSGLARDQGFEIRVVDGKLNFGPPGRAASAPQAREDASGSVDPGPLVLRQGSNLLRLRASVTSAGQVSSVKVRGWHVPTKSALVGTAAAGSSLVDMPATTPARLAQAVNAGEFVVSDTPYGEQAEVDAAARSVAQAIGTGSAELEGTARGNPLLRAGSAVAVDDLGEPFDGRYVVTTTRHVWDAAGGYVTHFSVTGGQERSLLGLASGVAASSRTPGVVTALVNDVKDPQGLGRVTLRFPWLDDDFVSDWARTVQPGAGASRGLAALSEVGDEVLVAFEQGDVRRPYVLGGLHNGKDTPAAGDVALVDQGSGKVNRRSWVSRSGHHVDLVDQASGTDGVTVSTASGKLKLTLDEAGTTIEVHSDGTVTIEGKGGVTVKGTGGVTVDAGSGTLSLKGGQVEVTASTGLKLDGGPQCTISGAMVKIN